MKQQIYYGLGLIAAIASMGYGIHYYQQNNIDYLSQEYAETVIPKLTKSWDPKALIAQSHPEMMLGTDEATITRLNKLFYEKLGSFKEINQCMGRAMTTNSKGDSAKISANYHCSTIFEKGTGTITLGLIQNNKQKWRISSFSVNSPLLRQ